MNAFCRLETFLYGVLFVEGMGKKELEARFMQYQELGVEIKQVQQQIAIIENQAAELEGFVSDLDEFKSLQEAEILVPIINGVFAKARLPHANQLFVNVGSQIVVPKSIESTKDLLSEQRSSLMEFRERLVEVLHDKVHAAIAIEQELVQAKDNV